ncbi:sialidase family protein [Flavihumibacter profundi]|uniref:sialidase family protein n=1 Tax=Flavihumibacter profundi TaxID=2716883 RepID=UPI001CC7C7DB|nr:sialidase family protein [Flavihumibacter profundi]MBZ5856178.1 glycoside hydrolase [Flavihumibacter profundi]
MESNCTKRIGFGVLFLLFSFFSLAQKEVIPVFIAGTEGYKSYRIPAIISLPDGKLLAFCEGRVEGVDDFGDINIVLKKSNNKGQTWTPLQTIVDFGNLQAGNPAPVLDMTDPSYPNGRVFLFYNSGNNLEGEVRKGNGLRESWFISSTDGGLTWSPPTNITASTHRPNKPEINQSYTFPDDWRSYANTPGHAIQLKTGIYKGRIYVAGNHSAGNPLPDFSDYKAHGFYTDDHTKTFHLSDVIPVPGGNESMAAELSGNRLMVNTRNQKGETRARLVSISSNGGQSWDTTFFDYQLPDPVCQGSILTLRYRKHRNIIAFCNAADTLFRDNLTLRISYDEGKNWNKSMVIDKGNNTSNSDHVAYSDMVILSRKKIGILYEQMNYSRIVFTVVKW